MPLGILTRCSAKIPRNSWIFIARVRKILGNSRIFIASCWIFLGIPGIFWDFDGLFCWMLQKFPGICGKFIERILGSCKRFLGIRSTSRDYYAMFCKNSQEFMDFECMCAKIPRKF